MNDRYGHDGGDAALVFIAHAVMSVAGTNGLCGRLGGEEFAVYLAGSTRAQAALIAAAIGTAVRNQPQMLGGKSVTLTVSMGLAEDRRADLLTVAMKRADEALYVAKSEGRDCFRFAEESGRMVETDFSAIRVLGR